MSQGHFIRRPKRIVDGIPMFSDCDAYVANYDQIAKDHLDHLADKHRSPFMVDGQIQQSEAATLDLVKRYLPAGSRILDAGVGMGNLLKDVPTYDRYGVDIALDYLKLAQRQGLSVAMAKLAELPYVDDYFDGVVICDVLEHLTDLDVSIAQIVRVMKPGGTLIVRVPNNEDLSSYVAGDRYSYVHVRTFNRESLRLYLEKCFKFKFMECDYCATSFYIDSQLLNPAPAVGADLRRVLPLLMESDKASAEPDKAALETLSKGLVLSLEEQVDALISLRDEYPALFAKLAPAVIRPAELIGVFQAP